jgi:hypothetical protein
MAVKPDRMNHAYDGGRPPGSEKRLKPLRGFRGTALPSQSLVVCDPDLGMVVDLMPCGHGHAQECTLMKGAQSQIQLGELWIADVGTVCGRLAIAFARRTSDKVVAVEMDRARIEAAYKTATILKCIRKPARQSCFFVKKLYFRAVFKLGKYSIFFIPNLASTFGRGQ